GGVPGGARRWGGAGAQGRRDAGRLWLGGGRRPRRGVPATGARAPSFGLVAAALRRPRAALRGGALTREGFRRGSARRADESDARAVTAVASIRATSGV